MEQKQINLIELDRMLEELAQKNWSLSKQIFLPAFSLDLAHECQKIYSEGRFGKAAVGHGLGKAIHDDIRGDFTYWIPEGGESEVQKKFWSALEQIRQALNQNFFLGLKRFETHFALYPPGSGYDKHIDNHHGLNHRKITFVLYLNEAWQKKDGGELSLFHSDENKLLASIEPQLGTLILFRSEVFPHQVEKSTAPRRSLTGWFRSDAL